MTDADARSIAQLLLGKTSQQTYVAQGWPNDASSTKDLCREFTVPTRDSYVK